MHKGGKNEVNWEKKITNITNNCHAYGNLNKVNS